MVKPVVQSFEAIIMDIILLSFLKLGYDFHLYTYEKVANVPWNLKMVMNYTKKRFLN